MQDRCVTSHHLSFDVLWNSIQTNIHFNLYKQSCRNEALLSCQGTIDLINSLPQHTTTDKIFNEPWPTYGCLQKNTLSCHSTTF